ncbi:MAG: hypothetical protein ACD_72C00442G0004 [uncultured bacterium]|nr:MAG: hypothetical protein ACD_72C00442G0004 [uncultured bacterium]
MKSIEFKKQFKPHEEYKNTNIDWIGNIPSVWSVNKIKEHFYFEKGKHSAIFTQEYINSPENIGDYPVYSGQTGDQGVMGMINRFIYNFSTPVVFTTTVGAKVMTPMLLKGKFSLSQNCLLMVPKDKSVDANYYYYQLFSLFKRVRDDIPNHMQPSLRISDLNKFVVVTPPYESQQKIADYLDDKTMVIDKSIEQKQKLIELLKEKRAAVINKAVTRGLDENLELVNSGVEWIGDIPKVWKIEKLKFVAGINRNTLSETTESDYNLKYIDIGNVDINGVKDEPEELNFASAPSRARRIVQKENIIVGTVRTYLKALAYFDNPESNLIVSTGFAVLEPTKSMVGKFIYYFVCSEKFIQKVSKWSTGVSYPAINPTTLGFLPVCIPPIDEQQKIIKYLDAQISGIEIAEEKIKKSIELLQEYKSSLVYNVVTGKVQV